MSLEQAILDRLEKRNGQIAQLQSTVHALERAADSQREHAMIERGLLLDENKKLVAQIEASQWNREHLEKEIVALRTKLDVADPEVLTRSERLIKSLNDEITKRDHELRAHEKELAEQREEIRSIIETATYFGMTSDEGVGNFIKRKCIQLENARTDLKQVLVERDSLGSMAADRAQEIRKLMDGHAEDMKAQAEVQSKYESILTKTTDLGSYAMTLGRKEGEPLEMFMERQALRLAALEAAITAAKCDELAKATARIKPLEALYKTLKGWQENNHIIGYGLTINTAINKATEALSQLTA